MLTTIRVKITNEDIDATPRQAHWGCDCMVGRAITRALAPGRVAWVTYKSVFLKTGEFTDRTFPSQQSEATVLLPEEAQDAVSKYDRWRHGVSEPPVRPAPLEFDLEIPAEFAPPPA